MKYALVANALVENVILWDGIDPAFADAFQGKQLVLLEPDSPASPGWTYANGEFLAAQSSVPPAPPAPRVVTMRQARLALLKAEKLAAVTAAIDTLSSPQKDAALIEWEYAATVDRDSALMGLVASALDLDEPALDALFATAAAF
ncbi:MAG: hypothetical protein ACRYGA_02430 [Janthinobacterium lividum]